MTGSAIKDRVIKGSKSSGTPSCLALLSSVSNLSHLVGGTSGHKPPTGSGRHKVSSFLPSTMQ